MTLDYWMLSRPEIKTAEQLKGGAVAISRFGSASDFIVRYALQRLGLVPVKDVAILQVGSLTERLAAMETNRVQATVLAPPAMYQAQMRGFNMLADISALGLPYQATGVAMADFVLLSLIICAACANCPSAKSKRAGFKPAP